MYFYDAGWGGRGRGTYVTTEKESKNTVQLIKFVTSSHYLMIVSATDGHATLRLRPCTGDRRGEEDIVHPIQLSQDPNDERTDGGDGAPRTLAVIFTFGMDSGLKFVVGAC